MSNNINKELYGELPHWNYRNAKTWLRIFSWFSRQKNDKQPADLNPAQPCHPLDDDIVISLAGPRRDSEPSGKNINRTLLKVKHRFHRSSLTKSSHELWLDIFYMVKNWESSVENIFQKYRLISVCLIVELIVDQNVLDKFSSNTI